MAFRLPRIVGAPHQGGGTSAEHISKVQGVRVGDSWCAQDGLLRTPAIAGLVEPEIHTAKIHIYEVGTARAIQVSEKEPLRVEVDVQMWRILHGDAFPEAAVSEVGPVLDPAVMHQDDVMGTGSVEWEHFCLLK